MCVVNWYLAGLVFSPNNSASDLNDAKPLVWIFIHDQIKSLTFRGCFNGSKWTKVFVLEFIGGCHKEINETGRIFHPPASTHFVRMAEDGRRFAPFPSLDGWKVF